MAATTTHSTSKATGSAEVNGKLRVTSLAELQKQGVVTATGNGHTIAVFWHNERAYAVDNRCPHMGFPLARGICEDGVLTCYWHYARFDLDSGGAFDIWAGDVHTYPVIVRDGEVWVDLRETKSVDERYAEEALRLEKALEQGIALNQAKSVLALLDLKPTEATKQIVATTAEFGLRRGSGRNPGGWGDGLTILTAMANLQPQLAADDQALSLYHGTRRVSDDAMNRTERILLDPLPTEAIPAERLKRWFSRIRRGARCRCGGSDAAHGDSSGLDAGATARHAGRRRHRSLLPRLLPRHGHARQGGGVAGYHWLGKR